MHPKGKHRRSRITIAQASIWLGKRGKSNQDYRPELVVPEKSV